MRVCGPCIRHILMRLMQIHDETGASVSTKGVWYPDRSIATEKDPPLYLHISATSPEMLKNAVDKVNDLINTDMGSLVEDKTSRVRERVRAYLSQFSVPELIGSTAQMA